MASWRRSVRIASIPLMVLSILWAILLMLRRGFAVNAEGVVTTEKSIDPCRHRHGKEASVSKESFKKSFIFLKKTYICIRIRAKNRLFDRKSADFLSFWEFGACGVKCCCLTL